MSTGESKTCTKCGEAKPLEEFYVDRRSKTGHTSACKVCVKAAQQGYNCDPDLLRERQRRFNASEKGRARAARYQATEKFKAAKRRYREANKEAIARSWAAYYKANRETLLARTNAWARENPDKKRAARDPEGMLLDAARRRARKRDAFVEDVPFDFILQRDLGVCGICQQQILDADIHLDHIVPLAAGGRHERSNVQLAHAACNLRKFTSVNFTLAS
jgi:5-methylcytosine-specific restriction endonuclease McrA